MGECTREMLLVFGGFCTVCMAGHTFGKILSPLGMPSITLFIFFGLVRHTAIRTPEALARPSEHATFLPTRPN